MDGDARSELSCHQLQRDYRKLARQYQQMLTQRDAYREERHFLRKRCQHLEWELHDLRPRSYRDDNRIADLEDRVEQLKVENHALRQQLADVKGKREPGRGPSTLMQSPPPACGSRAEDTAPSARACLPQLSHLPQNLRGLFAARKSLSLLISLSRTPAKPPYIMEGAFPPRLPALSQVNTCTPTGEVGNARRRCAPEPAHLYPHLLGAIWEQEARTTPGNLRFLVRPDQ